VCDNDGEREKREREKREREREERRGNVTRVALASKPAGSFHRRMVSSPLPETTCSPFGDTLRSYTCFVCPTR
jgi:hypothetical protein